MTDLNLTEGQMHTLEQQLAPPLLITGKVHKVQRPELKPLPNLAPQNVYRFEDVTDVFPKRIIDDARELQQMRMAAIEARYAYGDLEYDDHDVQKLHNEDHEARVEGTEPTAYNEWVDQLIPAHAKAVNLTNEFGYRAERFLRGIRREDGSGYLNDIRQADAGPEAAARQRLADTLAKADEYATELSRIVARREWFNTAVNNKFINLPQVAELDRQCPEQQAIRTAQQALPEAKPTAKAKATK